MVAPRPGWAAGVRDLPEAALRVTFFFDATDDLGEHTVGRRTTSVNPERRFRTLAAFSKISIACGVRVHPGVRA